jgi:hypothetical protein
MVMNKYILSDIVLEMLKKEMNLVDYPLPEELKNMKGENPTYGKVSNQAFRYKADKIKKVSVIKHDIGGKLVGAVIMIMGEDEYDFPFIVVNIAFVPGEDGKDKIFVEFEAKPLVKDEESNRKYTEPLRAWRDSIGALPSEPMSGFGEPGEFVKANISPIEYIRYVPIEYLDQVLDFTRQFFEFVLDFWRKAEPVKDSQRLEKIADFRREYNRHILEQDPSGRTSIATFGKEKALLSFENLTFL